MGMAYLLGDWATDHWAIAVTGRWIDADLYQACLIFYCGLIARRRPTTSRSATELHSGYGPLPGGWRMTGGMT